MNIVIRAGCGNVRGWLPRDAAGLDWRLGRLSGPEPCCRVYRAACVYVCVSVCVYVYIDRYITDSLLPSSPRPFIPSCQCSFARLLSVCLILQHCILLTKERCLQHHRKCCPGRGVFKFLLVFLEEKQCWKQRIFKS